MRRHLGRTLVLIVVGLGGSVAAVARTDWAGNKVCAVARARLPALLGMEVSLGQCHVDPLRGGVEIRAFHVTPPGAEEPLFAADRLLVRLRGFELLTGRIQLERVEAEHPRVHADLRHVDLFGRTPRHGCFLDHLARVEVDTFAVEGAEVHLLAPGGRTVDLDAMDVDLRLSRHAYTVRLAVPRGRIGTGKVELPLTKLRVSSSLNLERRRLTVNHLEVAAGELALSARGDVDNLCEPSFNLEASTYLPLDLVSAILGPEAPAMSGSAAVNLRRAEGTLKDPRLEIEVTLARARVEGFEVGDGYLEARLEKGQVKLDKLDLGIGEGKVRARGTLGLARGFPVAGSVELTNVGFGRLLDKLTVAHAWVDYAASGKVDLKGQIAPFHLAGAASLDVRDFRVYDRGWDRAQRFHILELDQAHVDLLADFNSERVRLSQARIRTPRGSSVDADVDLYFDTQKGMDLDAEPRELDLADLKHVVGIPWEGKLSGRAHLTGAYGKPIIDGELSIRDFRFHKVSLGTTEAQVRVRDFVLGFPRAVAIKGRSRFDVEGELDLRHAPRVRARGSFEGARLSDLVDALGDEHWVFDPLRGQSEARVSGKAIIEGPLLAARSEVAVSIEDFTYLDRAFGSGRLVFRAEDGERIFIDPLTLEGPCGKVFLAGRVDLDKAIAFDLDAPVLHVEELAKPNGDFLGARGTLAVKARFFGPPEHAQAEGTMTLTDLAAFGVGIGSGTLALDLDRTTLSVKGPVGTDLLVDGRVVFQGELPFAAGVSMATGDLGHYLPGVAGLKGSLAGEVLATGTLARYEQTRGDIVLSKLVAGKGDWSLQGDGPVALSFQGSTVELKSSTVKGPAGTRLTGAGMLSHGELDASVDGAFDARLLELFTPWLEQTGGRFQISATVSGPPSRPEVVGTARLENGRFTVHDWPVSGRDVRGRVEFSQNKLFVSDLEGTVNNGLVRLRGDVEMKEFSPQGLDLTASADEVQYRLLDVMPTTVSGDFRLVGPLSNLLLGGNVDLVRLHYGEEIDLDTFLKDVKRRKVGARSFEKREEFLRYDVNVHVPGGGVARIDNNLLRVALKGDLTVVGTNVHMGLLGTLNAEEGGRGTFRGNEYWIDRCAVDFAERDRIAAILDAHAETQVRDYKVWLHAFGPAEDPQVELRSEPDLGRTDIVALLTLGVTTRDQGAGTGMAGLVSDAVMNITGLDKLLPKFVPKNTILRNPNVRISTQYSDASGLVEPIAQFESRVLTDALKMRLSYPVISGRGRRAQLEYRFDDNWSVQGQWDNENATSAVGDLGFDFKLRMELE